METTTLPTDEDHRYGETDRHTGGDRVLVIDGRRFAYALVGPLGECRRTFGGPVEPGPYLFAVARAIVIDNHGGTAAEMQRLRETGRVFHVEHGDHVDVNGATYVVNVDRYGDPTFRPA